MKFFGVDKHVACVNEFRWIANKFGHTYQDMCMSGHVLVLGMRLGIVREIDGDAWCNMYREKLWEVFADKYGKLIEKFDAVVCGYPPLFAWLYKNIDVPVIINIPIRYEHGVDGHAEGWAAWNEYLREGIDGGKIYMVANNEYDKRYAEAFLCRPVRYIPAVCEYTGMTYNPLFPYSLYYAGSNTKIDGDLIRRKTDTLSAGHSYQRVAEYRSATWFPYNVSIMSTYEQYAAGMPMNFPTRRYAVALHREGMCYDQYCYNEQNHEEPRSLVEGVFPHGHDPNNYKDDAAFDYWIQHADAYNGRLDGITLFDSLDELNNLLNAPRHAVMQQSLTIRNNHDKIRAQAIAGWSKLFDEIRSNHA